MLFEVVTTASMLGVWGASHYYRTNTSNDSDKILKIAENCGLYKKDEKLRLFRRNRSKDGSYTEYVYKIPLGLELEDFTDKYGKFKDGLNNRSVHRIDLREFKRLKLDRTLLKQMQRILNNRVQLNKELEMEYDGMLKIRVYNEGLQEKYDLTQEIMRKCKPWHVALGRTLNGQVDHDFESGPHLLIGGATDMGKSNILNVIINTLLHNHADEVKFTLIDLKGGLEFGVYENIKQVQNFAADVFDAKTALENVQAEMSKTFDMLRRTGKKNVKQAGIKERHFVIIDESAELASEGEVDREIKKLKIECENLIKDIARRGRASGIRLLYCTQYPTAETVSSQVKRNLITRICLPVDTSTASGVVLDEGGAEKLPLIQGRSIYKRNRTKVMQSYFIDEDLISQTVTPHINFRARSEKSSASQRGKKEESARSYTTVIEEA
ncbi:FtsK/SpoIIIE domain-containing protein [Cytobacillus pseudoceanisediminis]|uniref:FtsK/SpoIIIE domain-containing protein n=1 Tax=Cytobacillus pseudoceanisediminis TaxID=3051614 RepID=UPI003CED2C4C